MGCVFYALAGVGEARESAPSPSARAAATVAPVATITPTPATVPEKKGEMDFRLGSAPEGKSTSPITDDWLKTIVSIEVDSGKEPPTPVGTGFLLQTERNHVILVTSKHVIANDEGRLISNLVYRFNNSERGSEIIKEEDFDSRTANWFLSEKADIACRFISWKGDFDIKSIPLKMVLRQQYVRPGAPLVVFGFPMGLRSESHPTAIARKGSVARSDADGLLLEAFIFPGSSGGPVFYLPTVSVDDVAIKSPFLNSPRLVGVVSSFIPYTDIAWSSQTKRPRITFEENSGLSNAAPADAIIDLIKRRDVNEADIALGK